MTKKKSKQAPKGTWRYGVVKRTYKTLLPVEHGVSEVLTEVHFELAEVFSRGRAYSSEARAITAESKAGLIKQMKKAIKDIGKYPVIVEKNPIVHDMRRKK